MSKETENQGVNLLTWLWSTVATESEQETCEQPTNKFP